MRFTERMTGLKAWITRELCEGREMKAPGPNMDISQIVTQEPRCYLAWAPARMDQSGVLREDPVSVVPGILIMPSQAHAKYVEEQRFDRYNNVHRPQEFGRQLAVSILFSVYEPGVRLPGFVDSVGERGHGLDMTKIMEGTEQGLFTLFNWMDDCMDKLLGAKVIPGTDLYVIESTMTYSLYTDQEYVTDRRPVYYGFVNVTFGCYATESYNEAFERMLD